MSTNSLPPRGASVTVGERVLRPCVRLARCSRRMAFFRSTLQRNDAGLLGREAHPCQGYLCGHRGGRDGCSDVVDPLSAVAGGFAEQGERLVKRPPRARVRPTTSHSYSLVSASRLNGAVPVWLLGRVGFALDWSCGRVRRSPVVGSHESVPCRFTSRSNWVAAASADASWSATE